SQRRDWYDKMILVALASAVGWGAGGMISYGMVVGYGHADNFINSFYGLAMLFVIGGLFGLLGGGLVGLTLDSTSDNKVKWGPLMAEMVAGGLISYYFLVEQIGFKMTPPRSEVWAVCLGAGLAMLWYMAREKRNSPIRVAFFSMLGAGIGFGFGNFLQIIGKTWDVPFNMWNVMEYSIGFFGGLGMAYGVFSSQWPKESPKPKKWENWASLLIVAVLIPLIVYRETLNYDYLVGRLENLPNVESVAFTTTSVAALILLLMAGTIFWKLKKKNFSKRDVAYVFFILLFAYTSVSYLVTGLFGGIMEITHHLYLINILVLFIVYRIKTEPIVYGNAGIDIKRWIFFLLASVVFMALLAVLAINLHGDIGGHDRFPLN
ncbi:MAG TPA: hypothetical protein VKZ93_02820, partial [Arenibacter sp.]|nr:hypothetical protein [Arenibacter sp.]